MSLIPRLFADLTDVTLADEDNNSIQTDGANRPACQQVMWQCKWRYLVAKIETIASGATLWPNLQLIQEAPTVDQIYN